MSQKTDATAAYGSAKPPLSSLVEQSAPKRDIPEEARFCVDRSEQKTIIDGSGQAGIDLSRPSKNMAEREVVSCSAKLTPQKLDTSLQISPHFSGALRSRATHRSVVMIQTASTAESAITLNPHPAAPMTAGIANRRCVARARMLPAGQRRSTASQLPDLRDPFPPTLAPGSLISAAPYPRTHTNGIPKQQKLRRTALLRRES